jgi:hypothetical protein
MAIGSVGKSQSETTSNGLPSLYALLRILFGLIGCVSLIGLSDLATFWDPTGLVPIRSEGWRQEIISAGWGTLFGRGLFWLNLVASLLMMVGYRTSLVVPSAFVLSLLHGRWNPLPLSAAFEIRSAILFCLAWADCGSRWSVDAWLNSRRLAAHAETAPGHQRSPASFWPLRLIRYQVALIYFSTGLWKLGGEEWRHGGALYYTLNNNGFARFASSPPDGLLPVLILGTYVTLAWELTFPLLLAFRRTRWIPLAIGVVMHLGMWLTMELGPFPLVMLASYVAFLSPEWLSGLSSKQSTFRPERRTEVA